MGLVIVSFLFSLFASDKNSRLLGHSSFFCCSILWEIRGLSRCTWTTRRLRRGICHCCNGRLCYTALAIRENAH